MLLTRPHAWRAAAKQLIEAGSRLTLFAASFLSDLTLFIALEYFDYRRRFNLGDCNKATFECASNKFAKTLTQQILLTYYYV